MAPTKEQLELKFNPNITFKGLKEKYEELSLPSRLAESDFGSIEGKTIVVTGATSK